MRIAIKSLVVQGAWIGVLFGGAVMAQQDAFPVEEIPAGQPTVSAEADGSSEIGPTETMDASQPCATCESPWLTEESCGEGCALGPCCEVCGQGNCCPPLWYTEQQVSLLTRNTARFVPFTYKLASVPQGTGQPALINFPAASSRDFGFGVSAGYSTTLGRYLGRDSENRDVFLEFSYWGMIGWNDALQVTGTRLTRNSDFVHVEGTGANQVLTGLPVTFGSLMSPFGLIEGGINDGTAQHKAPIGGFNRADRHQMVYVADIENFELNVKLRPRSRADRLVLHPNGNWRRECQPGWFTSFLTGIRLMTMDERSDFESYGSIQASYYDPATRAAVPFAAVPVTGGYRTRTSNDLIGLQIGADCIYRNCKWNYGFSAKAGPFINSADMSSHMVLTAAPATWDAAGTNFIGSGDPYIPADSQNLNIIRDSKRNGAALVGELELMASYKIRPNLSLNASYDFVWITGLAMAPEQYIFETDIPAMPKVNTNGHYIVQGANLGLEFLW